VSVPAVYTTVSILYSFVLELRSSQSPAASMESVTSSPAILIIPSVPESSYPLTVNTFFQYTGAYPLDGSNTYRSLFVSTIALVSPVARVSEKKSIGTSPLLLSASIWSSPKSKGIGSPYCWINPPTRLNPLSTTSNPSRFTIAPALRSTSEPSVTIPTDNGRIGIT